MSYPENDSQYYERVLDDVKDDGDLWALVVEKNSHLYASKGDEGFIPKPGMTARFYGRGFGYGVRGVFVDGHKLSYMSLEEEHVSHQKWLAENQLKKIEAFEANKAEMDKRYDALPQAFRERIDRLRLKDPNFRIDSEGYEMFCIEQAIVIAEALRVDPVKISAKTPQEWTTFYKGLFESFVKESFSSQMAKVPGLDEGHSGGTMGGALRLAYWYLTLPEQMKVGV